MDTIKFTLKSEFIELFKLLKATGLCESGGAAKQIISDGQVKVDGEVELRKAFKVRASMTIGFDNQTIRTY